MNMAYRTRVDDYCTGSDEIGQELSNGDLKTRRKDPIYGMSSEKFLRSHDNTVPLCTQLPKLT